MLSRVANNIYWMNRYIERAENYSRFIDVNLNLTLDLREETVEQWEPLVMATGDELTCDLLPGSVLGRESPKLSRFRGADLETLTYALVHEGINSAGPHEDSLFTKIVTRLERELLAQVMMACDNVQVKAANKLGVNRNTLHKKLREHGLE